MIINVVYDSSVNTCPQEAAFKACVTAVVKFYESEFTNPVTITWDLGWGEVDGSPIAGGSGAASVSNYTNQQYNYSQIRTAIVARSGVSAADTSAAASLGAADPTKGGGFSMTTAEAKALGLDKATTGIDGWSGLDTTSAWVFNTINSAGANVPAGGSDAFSFLAHELSEVMGRQMNFGTGSGDGVAGDGYYPYDLFDYSKAGVRALTNSATADRYFSINSGTSNTGQHWFNNDGNAGDLFDTIPNGQPGSYLPGGVPDSFDYAGSVGVVSTADLTLMDVLGYDPRAQVHWARQVSGSFATAADWKGGAVPGAANVAALDAAGTTAYTVTASTSETVTTIQTGSTATLAITGGTFDATLTTGAGTNAGVIAVSGAATLELAGVLNNAHTVSIGATAILRVGAGGLILNGAGNLTLAGAIQGSTAASTLTNGSLISGGGHLGDGLMTLINLANGTIEGLGASRLTLNTGANTITNLGLISAGGAGGLTISSAVNNTGRLSAVSGNLTVTGAVTGAGSGVVGTGILDFTSSFNEAVTFRAGATGALELAHSQAYTGKISGFSTTGTNALDLVDISFISGTTKASYSGTTASGVLTVTDGTHTAKINLVGDYVGSKFTVSAATGGGTKVVDPTGAETAPLTTVTPPHGFVAAMAGLGAAAGGHVDTGSAMGQATQAFLATPRFAQAA